MSSLLHKYVHCFYCLMSKCNSVLSSCFSASLPCHVHYSPHWLWALVPRLGRKKESYSWPMLLCKVEGNGLHDTSSSSFSWRDSFARVSSVSAVFAASYRRCLMFCLFLESFSTASDLAHTWYQIMQGHNSCSSWGVIFEKLHEIQAISKDSQLSWFCSIGQVPLAVIKGGRCVTSNYI